MKQSPDEEVHLRAPERVSEIACCSFQTLFTSHKTPCSDTVCTSSIFNESFFHPTDLHKHLLGAETILSW